MSEKVLVQSRIHPDIARNMRVLAATQDMSVSGVCETAFKEYIDRKFAEIRTPVTAYQAERISA